MFVSRNAVSRNTVFCFCPTHTGVRKRETRFPFRVSRFLSSVCARLYTAPLAQPLNRRRTSNHNFQQYDYFKALPTVVQFETLDRILMYPSHRHHPSPKLLYVGSAYFLVFLHLIMRIFWFSLSRHLSCHPFPYILLLHVHPLLGLSNILINHHWMLKSVQKTEQPRI